MNTPKIGVIYWSGTGNTERAAELIARGASEAGAEVVRNHVADASPDEISAFDVLALGSPALGSEDIEETEMKPFVETILPIIAGKKIALFGSHAWGDGEWLRRWAERMRGAGADMIGECLAVHETPEGETAETCIAFGRRLAEP